MPKLTDKTELTSLSADDLTHVVDVSDTTSSPNGTSKKITWTNIVNYLSSILTIGAASSTDNAIPKFDGTGGKTIQNSGVIIDDSNNVSVPGSISASQQPIFEATYTGTVANVTGDQTEYTITYNNILYNIGSGLNAGAGVFTAPVAGKYLFNFSFYMFNLNSSHIQAITYFTTTARKYQMGFFNPWNMAPTGNNSTQITYSKIVSMAAGDSAQVVFRVSGSTKTVGVFGDATNPSIFFSGYLLPS